MFQSDDYLHLRVLLLLLLLLLLLSLSSSLYLVVPVTAIYIGGGEVIHRQCGVSELRGKAGEKS